jgi:hypothetical protein
MTRGGGVTQLPRSGPTVMFRALLEDDATGGAFRILVASLRVWLGDLIRRVGRHPHQRAALSAWRVRTPNGGPGHPVVVEDERPPNPVVGDSRTPTAQTSVEETAVTPCRSQGWRPTGTLLHRLPFQ